MQISFITIFVRLLSLDLPVAVHRTGGVYHTPATHVKVFPSLEIVLVKSGRGDRSPHAEDGAHDGKRNNGITRVDEKQFK